MKRSQSVWTLEAKGREKGARWQMFHAAFSLRAVKTIQASLMQLGAPPHDWRIRRWQR